jgi:hypothetical protein
MLVRPVTRLQFRIGLETEMTITLIIAVVILVIAITLCLAEGIKLKALSAALNDRRHSRRTDVDATITVLLQGAYK